MKINRGGLFIGKYHIGRAPGDEGWYYGVWKKYDRIHASPVGKAFGPVPFSRRGFERAIKKLK